MCQLQVRILRYPPHEDHGHPTEQVVHNVEVLGLGPVGVQLQVLAGHDAHLFSIESGRINNQLPLHNICGYLFRS